jgi:hypothetical protein
LTSAERFNNGGFVWLCSHNKSVIIAYNDCLTCFALMLILATQACMFACALAVSDVDIQSRKGKVQ